MDFLETFLSGLAQLCVSFGGKLLAAIFVLIFGSILIKFVRAFQEFDLAPDWLTKTKRTLLEGVLFVLVTR